MICRFFIFASAMLFSMYVRPEFIFGYKIYLNAVEYLLAYESKESESETINIWNLYFNNNLIYELYSAQTNLILSYAVLGFSVGNNQVAYLNATIASDTILTFPYLGEIHDLTVLSSQSR